MINSLASLELSTFLEAGAHLLETASPTTHADSLADVLKSRLERHYASLSSRWVHESDDSEDLQLETALAAISVVESVQRILKIEPDAPAEASPANQSGTDVPAIGTRDLSLLRTLLSVAFKWGTKPLLLRVSSAWPSVREKTSSGSHIVDLTGTGRDYEVLSGFVSRLLSLLFFDGPQSKLPQTLITTSILSKHVADILHPAIAVAWLPKTLNSDTMVTLENARPFVLRLLAVIPPSQAIVALGAVLSSESIAPHVRKVCSGLLSRQLLRPDGVQGFFAAIFGDEDTMEGEVDLAKLEHSARILTTPPANMTPSEYFGAVISRLLLLTSDSRNLTTRRAAAFSVSRLLENSTATSLLLPMLHHSLVTPLEMPDNGSQTDVTHSRDGNLPAEKSLSTLVALVLNSDPSPTLISTLLSPVVPALYSLLFHFEQVKTSDPGVIDTLRGLLRTWGRVIGQEEGLSSFWKMIHDDQPGWQVDLEGHIRRLRSPERSHTLALLTPEDESSVEDIDENTNILNLYPDPVHFVQFLRTIERSDITPELFVKLLDSYRSSKSREEQNPLRTLLYLQLVIQIQTQLTESGSASNILGKPSHILSFIKHALESAIGSQQAPPVASAPKLPLEKLKIVEDDLPHQLDDEADSDDESPDSVSINPDDEITETALNLLLSILEVHETLSARTEPILNDIFELLEPLALSDATQDIRSLAREARMVMTARLASTSSSGTKSRNVEQEDAQATYQKALKLLQDPILPVRAHGLLLLRQLVAPPKISHEPRLQPALVPAILSIFLQSIQDDESYIFLNAVQGLSLMVETYGGEVLGCRYTDTHRGSIGSGYSQKWCGAWCTCAHTGAAVICHAQSGVPPDDVAHLCIVATC
ncbi:hypothetical protein HGRIS_009961 [Hohenbuehelia grisea]|uniref:RNA polymerase II assembly factor Rtp1 C-terminal domain-containing protein n=1 Tax=Hohenbuehelia grisea TaxID=104357 RepID=A0ABR3J2U1_9AGAR